MIGIKLSDYLQEYPCKIHTLELVLKDGDPLASQILLSAFYFPHYVQI